MRSIPYWILLLSILWGCSKTPEDRLDSYKDGRLLFTSALLEYSLRNLPIGKPSGQIMDSLLNSHAFQDAPIPARYLFHVDTTNAFCSIINLNPQFETFLGNRTSFTVHLFRDTAVSMSMVGITHNQSHIDATIRLLTSQFGEPTVRRYIDDPNSGAFVERKNEYFWGRDGITARYFHRGDDDLYSLEISGPDTGVKQYWDRIPAEFKRR